MKLDNRHDIILSHLLYKLIFALALKRLKFEFDKKCHEFKFINILVNQNTKKGQEPSQPHEAWTGAGPPVVRCEGSSL